MAKDKLPHLVVTDYDEAEFTSVKRSVEQPSRPQRLRDAHSQFLKRQLDLAWQSAETAHAVHHADRKGVYIEFKGEPGYELATKSLESLRSNNPSNQIRLLNVRHEKLPAHGGELEKKTIYATIFVPHNKKDNFFKKIEEYATEETARTGNFKNAPLVESISDIKKALDVESFWQDDKSLVPADNPEWCEVWLSSDCKEVIQRFEQLIDQQQINAKQETIVFPDRAVKLVYVNRGQLETLSRLSDDIAEYRRAKETAAFWLDLENREQAEWMSSILKRLQVHPNPDTAVCILDTGVNRGHPLISPVLSENDCISFNPDWGSYDHDKHGTLMAGVSVYNKLQELLLHNENIIICHRLESVKILPPKGANEPDLWGYITAQAIYKAEIQAPRRRRVVCMAVTSSDSRDRGRPSSWSGALDQLSSGAEDDRRRLLIISAGNAEESLRGTYPAAQLTDSVHDPAQSWNALTIGAYTLLDNIQDEDLAGYVPVAPKGGLSPFSTTSNLWDDAWPIKPELVLEGGNLAKRTDGFTSICDDLSLLSTYYDPQQAHLYPFCMTSAATAQAAWIAAQISVRYPDFWPETIRALMVHSADWTDALKKQFCANESKSAYKQLLRTCGYGVPDLEKALFSASDRLTLISEAEIQPFDQKDDGGYRTRDMHLYELPWPKDVLQAMPSDAQVTMRITLSYFIEPSPGEVGWKDRYRYASHGLRFDLNSPTETRDQFVRRINQAARDDENGHPGTTSPSDHWVLGQARDKGSIHSDIWQGSAAELAESNLIAISPRIGWWRERHQKGRWNRKTCYSLIVSIETKEAEVDIYTPVSIQLQVPVTVDISV